MTSRDFRFWLQGFFELTDETGMSAQQSDMVKRHLALVFTHEIDPSMGDPSAQHALNAIHDLPGPSAVFDSAMAHLTAPQTGPIKYRY